MAQIMKKTIVKKEDGKILVKSEYNTLFVKKARFLGGSWDRASSAWSFPDSRESLVKEILREIYGTDGEEEPAIVTVQINLDLFYDTLDSEIYLGTIAPDVAAELDELVGVTFPEKWYHSCYPVEHWRCLRSAGC